jgi:transposase
MRRTLVRTWAPVGFRRIEILTGPGRRRRWSAEEKARVVEETLEPGARVSEVARRWQVCPQQVFAWRRAARRDGAVDPRERASPEAASFVPIVADATASEPPPPVIEVKLAGAVVQVSCGMDSALLTTVLRAIRASASRA